jgi:methionine synthase II (cobalamin-independent)
VDGAPNLAAQRRWHGDTLLQAGLADARHIRVEPPEVLQERLEAVTARAAPARCLVTPSAALLYLPRRVAFEKLAALADAARASSLREAES